MARHAERSQHLDDVDRAHPRALAADARIPNTRLAERVGVAPSTAPGAGARAARRAACSAASTPRSTSPRSGARCRRWSPSASSVHSREQIESFTEHVRALPGVLSVFHVTGQTDYLVWVAAADAQDLREFVVEHLASDPAVAHAETSLIYEQRRGPGCSAPTGYPCRRRRARPGRWRVAARATTLDAA